MSRKYETLLVAMRERDVARFARVIAVLPARHRDIVLSALKGETQAAMAVRLEMKQPNISRTLAASFEAIKTGMGAL